MKCYMNTSISNSSPAPPSIFAVLRAGFDAVSNRVGIILFPVSVDLFIWLGPHIGIKKIILDFIDRLSQTPGWEGSPSSELFEANFDILTQLSGRINLMGLLRSYPVGIPSLMAGIQPIETPIYEPLLWAANSIGSILLIGIFIMFIGLAAGTVYYLFVSHLVLYESVDFREAIRDLPRAFFQVIIFLLVILGLMIIVSFPASCILSIIALSGLSLGQFVIFLFIGILLWMIFPILLTPQIIIMQKKNAFSALKNSMSITRMTLPTTGMLFAIIFLISEGLDILWRIPEESSWLTLLGILGHAFVTTSLLASTFFYYRDAERWTQSVFRKVLLSSSTK